MKKRLLAIVISVLLVIGGSQVTKAEGPLSFAKIKRKLMMSSHSESIIHREVLNGETKMVENLLKAWNVAVNVKGPYGLTALHLAAGNGDADMLDLLSKYSDENIMLEQDSFGKTALHYAAEQGHKDIVIKLLRKCESIKNVVDNYGLTALHYALEAKQTDVAMFLLKEKGINANVADGYDRTALHYAAYFGLREIVELLLDREDVDKKARSPGGEQFYI